MSTSPSSSSSSSLLFNDGHKAWQVKAASTTAAGPAEQAGKEELGWLAAAQAGEKFQDAVRGTSATIRLRGRRDQDPSAGPRGRALDERNTYARTLGLGLGLGSGPPFSVDTVWRRDKDGDVEATQPQAARYGSAGATPGRPLFAHSFRRQQTVRPGGREMGL
ncbi:uncharacterized protein PSFLO_01928 [Pseudozyma flocculosa]|uniref:Uncharacterized protein n=1 Tax=Pseudozyma flocculosa TaxID=84751 RepID=A0A5C3EYI7_9BASI|nr:uncharacterized protein PSFLO_01928 [Pseudozyma flocculosa]